MIGLPTRPLGQGALPSSHYSLRLVLGDRVGCDRSARIQRSGSAPAAYLLTRKEATAMPATRRTQLHVQKMDDFGVQLVILTETVEEVTRDGFVEPNEAQLLHRVMTETHVMYQALPADASVIDRNLKLARTLLDTLSVTAWTERQVREAVADEQRLIDQGLIEAVAA